MKISNPRTGFLLLLPLFVLFTIGCGSSDTAEPIQLDPAELTMVTFQTGGAWSEAMEAVVDKFQETYPDITVDQQGFGRWPQSYLTDNLPPDMMAMGANRFLREAMHKRQLVDLTDVWIQSGLRESMSPAFQDLSVFDGKQYYLPIGFSWSAIYYNKQIFDRYGLTPPSTWDEFLVICDTLSANGEIPISIGTDGIFNSMVWFSYLNLRLNGPEFHRELINGQARYDDPRVQDVLETWRFLIDSNYFVDQPNRMGSLETLTAIIRTDDGQLNRQKAVMALTYQSEVDDLPSKFQDELDFFPFPIMNSSVPASEVVNGFGYMVPIGGQNIPQTLEFLSYMSTAEAQTILIQRTSGAVSFAPANTQVDANILTADVQRGRGIIDDAEAYVTPFMFNVPNSMWSKIEFGLRQFFNDEGTTAEFIADLEEARQRAQDQGDFLTP